MPSSEKSAVEYGHEHLPRTETPATRLPNCEDRPYHPGHPGKVLEISLGETLASPRSKSGQTAEESGNSSKPAWIACLGTRRIQDAAFHHSDDHLGGPAGNPGWKRGSSEEANRARHGSDFRWCLGSSGRDRRDWRKWQKEICGGQDSRNGIGGRTLVSVKRSVA